MGSEGRRNRRKLPGRRRKTPSPRRAVRRRGQVQRSKASSRRPRPLRPSVQWSQQRQTRSSNNLPTVPNSLRHLPTSSLDSTKPLVEHLSSHQLLLGSTTLDHHPFGPLAQYLVLLISLVGFLREASKSRRDPISSLQSTFLRPPSVLPFHSRVLDFPSFRPVFHLPIRILPLPYF